MRGTLFFLALCGWISAWTAQTNTVPAPEPPPWCPSGVGCTSVVQAAVDGMLVSGNASLRMGADGVFDRPVLLVEGFDFGHGWNANLHGHGSVTWHGIFGGDAVNFPLGLEYRTLLDELHDLGADVLFLDFEAGTASLEHKAALLSFVITLALDAKSGQSPGILVGVSMGGLVGRLALAQWEQEGHPHCFGQFHSVDAPHFGATMPVGLQALVLALSNQSEQGALLWHALNSSAGRQLLQHHIAGGDDHEAAMALMSEAGWPQSCVNLGVINSRSDAHADLTSDPLLHMEWGLDGPVSVELAHVTADRWDGPASEGGASLLLPGTLWPGDEVPLFQSLDVQFTQPEMDAESQPGATAGHLQLLAHALTTSVPLDLLHESVQTDVTFVPWTSAAASTEACPEGPFAATSLASMSAPRETHASLPSHHRNWMMSWINALWDEEWPEVIQGPDQVVTFGWNHPRNKVVQEVLVKSNGRLMVGNNDSPFAALTSACDGEIWVQDDGEIHVGSPQGARGELSISYGTSLNIGPNGRVVIHEGSTLTVLPHATLAMVGGSLEIRPGGKLVVLSSARIRMDEGAVVQLDEGSQWTHAGHLNVRPGQTSLLNLDGNMDWKPGSTLWVGNLAKCHWNLSEMACFQFDANVTWTGSGRVNLEGGQGSFLPEGQLTTGLQASLEGVQWTGQQGASAHLVSKDDVTVKDCHLGTFQWRHEGETQAQTLILFENNHWDIGWAELQQPQLRAWDNQFNHVTFHVSEALSPSRLVNNRWIHPWYANAAALKLESCDAAVWVESNAWHGGVGMHLHDASATFACNAWEGCTEALRLEGTGQSCFSNACGGGGNAWLQNDLHFHLLEAALPQLSQGQNQLGSVSELVASGITTTSADSWHIQQASWDISLLDNPLLSLLPTNVQACSNGTCEDVSWWADGLVPPYDCHASELPKPLKQKTLQRGTWNVLGQEVPFTPE